MTLKILVKIKSKSKNENNTVILNKCKTVTTYLIACFKRFCAL